MIAALLLALFQDSPLKNGDFEAKEPKPGAIAAWAVSIGAKSAIEPVSELALDGSVKHGGHQSLRFVGDAKTRAWKMITQEVDVRPLSTVRLHGFAKTENVHAEKPAGMEAQPGSCYFGLAILDKNGQIVAHEQKTPQLPTIHWQNIGFEVIAPESARRARVTVFLAMSGKLWVDDLAVEVRGGRDLPHPEVLYEEGFDTADAVPPEWHEVEGAHVGEGDRRVKIAIDPAVGAPGSPRSLTFAGDNSTVKWFALQRTVPAAPGDVVKFKALVKAADVKLDKGQTPNLHVHVFFRDKSGQNLCAPQYGNGAQGSYDWKELAVEALAPVGTAEACFGIFFSMSGQAWFDKLEVSRLTSDTPAFADWLERESVHFTLRYPKDHPKAADVAAYGAKLDAAFESLSARLSIKFSDKMTAYLYRDAEQGKKLAARDLDFAEPEARAIHLRPDAPPGRETAKVFLRRVGFAQTELLGEGVPLFLNGEPAEEHHARAAKLLAAGKLPALDALLGHIRENADAMAAAASFSGYLIDTFGMEKVKRLYVLPEPAKNARLVLDKPLSDADAAWREWLAKGKPASAPDAGSHR